MFPQFYGYPGAYNQYTGYGYQQPYQQPYNNWARIAQLGRRIGAMRAAAAGGDVDLIAGAGEVDFWAGADPAEVDADAEALLAGFDLNEVGGEFAGFDLNEVGADIIGADEIDVGAAKPRPPDPRLVRAMVKQTIMAPLSKNPKAALSRAVRMGKALQAQPVIVEKPYSKTRTLPLGIDSQTEIAANSAVIISVIPNAPFKARYLLIPDDVAADFVITQLNFGRINGLGGSYEVPASTYQESGAAALNEFDVPALPPGIPIQMGVRNVSGAARRFRARFQGSVLES